MIRLTRCAVCALSIVVSAALSAAAEEAAEQPIVRIYRVVDLIMPAPNYRYDGTVLPEMHTSTNASGRGGGMGGGMGGMGGMGGGMGGGMFRVPDYLAQLGGGFGGMGGAGGTVATDATPSMSISMDTLIEAITTIVEPESWDEFGGPGTIHPIGGALAVRQLPGVQLKIEDFLAALRREGGASRVLVVDARWLWLDREQIEQLLAAPDTKAPAGFLDPKRLAALPAEAEQYSGRICCFNGQTVHIVSGRMESLVSGAIPVVGGSTEVGYQPLMLAPHLGVFLQCTPSTLPDDGGAFVDLHSTITRWDPPQPPARLDSSGADAMALAVDRLNVAAQQFATSVRMPLGKPMLIGGINFPARPAAQPTAQGAAAVPDRAGLYLVLEVSSDDS